MGMLHFGLFPILLAVFYLAVIALVFFLVITWANKIIKLKQEQNDLLREILKKMDNKQ